MELRGLEPLTSSMPWKRATNCAKAPHRLWIEDTVHRSDRSYIRARRRANQRAGLDLRLSDDA